LTNEDILAQGPYIDIEALPGSGQRQAYVVTHTGLKRKIVVKIGTYVYPEDIVRIKREVMLLKEIDSPYYPKNYDFKEVDGGHQFVIEEEYINAPSLDQCTERFAEPAKLLGLMGELVIGLDILWKKRVVHRDVKPGNILILKNGSPCIIDLGIARLLYLTTATVRGGAPYTPGYAAPEQMEYNKETIDYRTDQFPLGIIMLQLLMAGDHPFHPRLVGDGISVVENIKYGRWCRGEPRITVVQPLASRLLGHEPYMRYRDVGILLEEIRKTKEGLL